MKFGRRFHPALMTALIISSIAGVVGAAGCGGSGGAAGGGGDGGALTVFAAASLTDAFGELEERFEKRNPG